MANKEKEIELKVKAEKISQPHLEEMRGLINKVNNIHYGIGRLEIQKHTALHDISSINDQISLLQQTFEKEYGTYDINIVDGTINWPKEGEEKNEE